MRTLPDGRGQLTVSPTTRRIVAGEEDLSTWDDEELIRGKRRNKNGKFTGRPSKVVPIDLHRELTRRRFSRAYDVLAESLLDAAKLLTSIIKDKKAEPHDRIRAAEILMNRLLGRPKQTVEFDMESVHAPGQEPAWTRLIAQAIVGSADQLVDVVEAEVVEDEPEDESPPTRRERS